jgi:hypothetical protein
VTDLFGAYEQARPGTPVHELVGAVAALVAWGMLETAACVPPRRSATTPGA